MNRKDKRRARRLREKEMHDGKKADRGVPPSTPDLSHTPAPAPAPAPAVLQAGDRAGDKAPWQPGQSGNPQTQWQPGQSGNRNGYSRGRRYSDDFNALVAEMGAVRSLSKVWLKRALEADPKFFEFILKHCQDQSSKDRDPVDLNAAIPLDPVDATLDPAVAERLMAAAQPDVIPFLEDEETE